MLQTLTPNTVSCEIGLNPDRTGKIFGLFPSNRNGKISQQSSSKKVLEIAHKPIFAIFGRYDTYACDNFENWPF